MIDLFEGLNLANGIGTMVCPRCSNAWSPRIEARTIKKCPYCQHLLIRSRERWPEGYVNIRFRMPTVIPKGWPTEDDPDPEPDMEWQREQNHLAFLAEMRMRGLA